MDEFLKLSWRIKGPSDLESQLTFLSEEIVADSYVYKNFIKPVKAKNTAKLSSICHQKHIPGKKYYRQIARRSILTKNEKKQCLNAMKVLQSGKQPETFTMSEKFSLQLYTECQAKIVEERRLFLEYVHNIWDKWKTNSLKIRPALLHYASFHWHKKIEEIVHYNQFYKEVSLISLNYSENEGRVSYEHVLNILDLGSLARFASPSLKEQCILKLNTLPAQDYTAVQSKMPVSRDGNILDLLTKHKIDIVISSSALKQIIDYSDTNSKWTIPIVVKEIDFKEDNNTIKKKVVCIDKVLPKTNPTYHDLKSYAYKKLLKTNFCQYQAFSFPNNDIVQELNNKNEAPLEENSTEKTNKETPKMHSIHHNVSYRIWKVLKTSSDQNNLMKNFIKDTEIRLLVRCKLDACEITDQGVLQPVMVNPKIENQLQYGVNIATKRELAREWASLFFRLYSNMYRARIHGHTSEVVAIEKCTLQKINTEAFNHHQYKPVSGLDVLERVMRELMHLECGHYLLQHLPKHGAFVAVLQSCEERTPQTYDLHSEYQNCEIDKNATQTWVPIDVNYILPVHEEYNKIPASFQGFDLLKTGSFNALQSNGNVTIGTMSKAKFLVPLTRLLRPFNRSVHESFLTGASSQYVEDMYNAWLKNPENVHASWNSYFQNVTKGSSNAYQAPPNLAPLPKNHVPLSGFAAPASAASSLPTAANNPSDIKDHLSVTAAIRSYQARGHLLARLDPLGIMYTDRTSTLTSMSGSPSSIITRQNKLVSDMERKFKLPETTFIGGGETELPLKEILKRLELAYCRHIGVEYMHIDNVDERTFIRKKMETPHVMELPVDQKRLLLERLTRSCYFESFLAKKWVSVKRFGLEGLDVMIPVMKSIIDKSTEMGVDSVIIAMAHRGRLNVLANVCRRALYKIFAQFEGLNPSDYGSGDVKYHLGASITRLNRATNKQIKITLVANPSHLEAANGICLGKTRAEQFYKNDTDGKTAMAILIHGDASFCGQGVVYETLHLSYLPGYATHGVIHIVANNQIGFTTDPRHSRASRYCSDVGKVVNAPIFHVNSDDPESAIHVANVAAEYRSTFHKDIVVDIVGYRRNGHNEADQPMFTQPLMYTKINALAPIIDRYSAQLIEEKVMSQSEVDKMRDEYLNICQEQFDKAKQEKQIRFKDWLDSCWSGFFQGKDPLKVNPTGVSEDTLRHIGNMFSSPPPKELEFVMHKGLDRILKMRKDMVDLRLVDWSLGEAMAYGSLVKEGVHVRLSGEDVERGTFSHRHHVFHHQTKDKITYNPLCNLYPDQAIYSVVNSSLSEYGVMGFELGFSQTNPNALVMWEAQFGDFSNVAQCIIDQFLASGQQKWVRQSGLVLQLPHGYEGMGPEHSSARPERFLQMCDDDPDVIPSLDPDLAIRQLFSCNWIIANCTTPANLFHILRRQVALPFRKPLVLMTPKSLLRHPEAKSSFDAMVAGTEFQRVIPENGEASTAPDAVQKLLFCTGKVYYDAIQARKAKDLDKKIAVARVEQMSPFPYDLLKIELDKYKKAKVFWVQEEPKNGGAYDYARARLTTLLNGERKVGYIGRPTAAAPAVGSAWFHAQEVQKLAADIVTL